jgi:DNA polymerase
MTTSPGEDSERWAQRQRAMLAQMGIRLWSRPPADPTPLPETAKAPGSSSPPEGPPTPEAPGRLAPIPQAAPPVPPTAGLRSAPGPRLADRPAGIASGILISSNSDIGTMDGPTLRAAVDGCTACGLSQSRSRTVFGTGHERAHWMIVGEAPGEQEDRLGEPFVGPSGQLLDNMLRAVGLSRLPNAEGDPARQVFITNALKCRPPVNRNPKPDELAQCAPYLRRQVALVRPRLILAMGRFAVQALLGTDTPLGQLRGRVHHCEGVPTVVTYHPAYLLRNLTDKARAWEDLCLARRVAAAAGEAGASEELDAPSAGVPEAPGTPTD